MDSQHGPNHPEVQITSGPICGRYFEDVARFSGIPYAAAPVGDLRFRPPQPVEPWTEVRDVGDPGCISPQNPNMMEMMFGGESERWDEDCLYLNVWTAAENLVDPTPSLPVMVWIHGGGFEMGSGSSPMYNGERFARNGTVFVTLNYRLGALGFLDLSSLDPSYAESGNLGLLDQVQALEWVRDNIAQFGGNPDDVTVFGQSAGSMSVSLLLSMERTTGLFSKAIAQSGGAVAARTPQGAASDTAEFMAAGGWSTVDDVRSAPAEALLAAHASMSNERIAHPTEFARKAGTPLAFLAFRPVADGVIVPTDPLAAIANGSAAGVNLVTGSTSEEWKLFALITPTASTEDDLLHRYEALVADPAAALDTYQREYPGASVADLEGALITDLVFRIPANQLADAQSRHAEVYQYLWAWQSSAFGGMIGAAHAIEIPFVFDLVEDHRLHIFIGSDAPASLAAATNESWLTFAKTGSPATDTLGEWPTVDQPNRPTMVLNTESKLMHDPNALTREFWETPAAARPSSQA